MTVASFATRTHWRPSTTPIPVTIPAEGASPSYSSQAASAFSSRNARPGIDEPVDPLPRGQLPARAVPLDGLLAATGRDERRALAELGDEPLHPARRRSNDSSRATSDVSTAIGG